MAYNFNANPDPFHNTPVIRRVQTSGTNKTIVFLFALTVVIFALWYMWIQSARAAIDPKYVYHPTEHQPDPVHRR